MYESEFETCGGCGWTEPYCTCDEEWTAVDWLIFVGLILGLVAFFGVFLVGAWTLVEAVL